MVDGQLVRAGFVRTVKVIVLWVMSVQSYNIVGRGLIQHHFEHAWSALGAPKQTLELTTPMAQRCLGSGDQF
jgi:hypothetical protein